MMSKSIRITINSWLQWFKNIEKITAFDLAIFLRQFATLISANIPIIQSCDILAKSQEKNVLRVLIYTIKRDILSGKDLFYCLQRHSYFDNLTCRLIQIGEQTGKLDSLLNLVADYHEKNQLLRQKIKQALFYPCLIAIVAILMTLCMLIFVIPRFAELFQNTQVQLPFLTECIFNFAKLLREYLWLLIISAFFIFLIIKFKYKHHHLRNILKNLPFIKIYLHKINLARFTRHLALTISAGIPITNALALTATICGNGQFSKAIIQLQRKISAGTTLHQAMTASPLFPALMIQMIKIGEESGMLENMLNKFTDFTETDINRFTQRLNLLLEPLIMIVLGVLIGGLVIGIYLPIFKLGNAI